ncbi:MAG: RNA polymerase sigma factor SigZ [Nitrospirota bacterium]|nr:RNA polymerase sigma factor SigZ [Nitrospirota bacterium]MDP2382259.1 RNA polymerase sigma factor SigZ [Nitrospirota bacterium]MDP3597472.1 RNA polymerase sigma factor SigZ [Nitrospirota bacterium]
MMPDSQHLWDEVQSGLHGFIRKRVTDEAAAEDLSQEVFIRMQRGLEGLKDQSRLLPWIYRIARHVIIDYYRVQDTHPERPAGLASDLETLYPASLTVRSSEDSGQLRRELAGCLRPMIARLSEDYRQAVTLIDLEGLAQHEAAARLGLTVSGMKSRVQRGRRQLREMLEACCAIALDRRRGVADYDVRDRSCRDRPRCSSRLLK